MDLVAIETSLRSAIGQKRTIEDDIVPATVERLAVTLESGGPVPRRGDPLPAGWHAVFCLKSPTREELGEDGLPKGFDQIPPVPMQRRMFGGARLTFHAPVLVGDTIRCESELVDAKTRTTAGGLLAIATLRHRFYGPAGLAIEEEQDIIHMEPVAPAASKPADRAAPKADGTPPPTWQRTVVPDEVMLFRYSALTFNSHRIHYDAPYSREAEKLPALMVQGKLIALQLFETVRTAAPQVAPARFEFRSGQPLFLGDRCRLNVALDGTRTLASLWAENGKGKAVQTASMTMKAPVT